MFYIVGRTSDCKRLAVCKSMAVASKYIESLPEHEDGRYYIDACRDTVVLADIDVSDDESDRTEFSGQMTTDTARGTTFTPYLENGRVGYVVKQGDKTEYVYFNPTDESSDCSSSDVFVYQGDTGDPAIDGSVVFLDVGKYDSEGVED